VAGFADNEGVPDLEGTNLIPFLSGNQKGSPHQVLYWRYGSSAALRFGDWKIVKSGSPDFQLYNLSDDLSETTNLAQQNPEKLAELKALWEKWNKQNIDPLFPPPRRGPAGGFMTPLKTISN
jgi:arylsulfatase B